NERLVLQAMFIKAAASVPVQDFGFARTVSILAGLSVECVESTLTDLARRNILAKDSIGGGYSFWPVGGSGFRAPRIVDEALQRTPPINPRMVADVTQLLRHNGFLPAIQTALEFGHSDDWAVPVDIMLISQVMGQQALVALAKQVRSSA